MARWQCCNILQTAPDANRFWQFESKGGGFVLNRELSVAHGGALPAGQIAKSWGSLWQPKLNVAWLPPESVFLRVVELPKSSFGETLAMVELQLEKLSPIPVAQIVWTLELLPQAPAENLQTVVVVIVERKIVESFLGKLEAQNYLVDRLEVPMLDQLAATPASETAADAWIYPALLNGQNAALVAWWSGGALRHLSFVVMASGEERAKNLGEQFTHLAWAGELEGWLTTTPRWHLVAEGAVAGDWEPALREGLGEPVQVSKPMPLAELAARTARRAAAAEASAPALLPGDFTARYHQEFVDRLWLRGLMAAGVLYAVLVAIYFCAVGVLGIQTRKVEQQVAAISGSYTNVLKLKAQYEVLKERQDLKYAALDCWKLVAETLPAGVSLQRFSFGDGQTLSLNGTTTPDQVSGITDFYDALRKSQLNGQPMFTLVGGEPLSYRLVGGQQETWNFVLKLQHTEESP